METATDTAAIAAAEAMQPSCLKDAPSLIERLWPAQKISAEAQKERKAGAGQTLTALGSYWKGRKPLILVRACVLAALLPATDDPEEDLAVFEMLMRIDDESFLDRVSVSASEIAKVLVEKGRFSREELTEIFQIRRTAVEKALPCPFDGDIAAAARSGKITWADDLSVERKSGVTLTYLECFSYSEKVAMATRPEDLEDPVSPLSWDRINRHLGTNVRTLPDLIEQLGVKRFGHRPRVADTFAGGGSIPFEAARIGCDVYASDLNPVACMLTWGSFNIVGASDERRDTIFEAQSQVASKVDRELINLRFECDENGNRAKAYLYCLEAKCPSSGWFVPLLPSLLISFRFGVVARLVPDPINKRYEIKIDSGVSHDALRKASQGTLREGYLVHNVEGSEHRTSIKALRGDFRRPDGSTGSNLRAWTCDDLVPRPQDVFQERLYCIQWMTAKSLGAARPETFFSEPLTADLERERAITDYVKSNLSEWQRAGLVPDMRIEPGYNTDQPIRERGWTYWHHLFSPRALLTIALLRKFDSSPEGCLSVARSADRLAKLCRFNANPQPSQGPKIEQVFSNQALNTLYNYGVYTFAGLDDYWSKIAHSRISGSAYVSSAPASQPSDADIFVTDPPYADAVHYHEITEFFIAWLRKNPPSPFDEWTWDSRRALAIKGDGEEFRREMVAAYRAMADHMPDNGLQIVMFTHQSGSVWADMAQIFWGAGLQVQAAWYIATETTSELKKGGYVQGTVILVLRKRSGDEAGYEDEIAQEVRAEVARQIDTLVGLNQSLKGAGRIENLFEDADLQMAGYAAALRVLTGYTCIDGRDMTAEAVRPRKKGEKGFVDRVIEFAVQVANEHMVPEGLTPRLWQQLSGTERFYLKMIDLEAAGLKKLDNYQNFARAFRVPDYSVLMGDVRPNAAAIKRADDFKDRTGFDIPDFGQGIVRAALYGVHQLSKEAETDVVMDQLRGMVENYYRRRDDLVEVAEYIATQRGRDDEREGRYAALLAQLIRNERLG